MMCAGDCSALARELVLLVMHIFVVATLVIAPAEMLVSKGGTLHRRWGKIYVGSWAAIVAMSLVWSFFEPFNGPALIALPSFYLAFTGYRALFHKTNPYRARWPDWLGMILAAGLGLGLFVHGLGDIRLYVRRWEVVIGAILILSARFELWYFLRPRTEPRFWWFKHMRNMLGSYLGALTAASLVNLQHFLPVYIYLSIPWVIGVPLIGAWVFYYKKVFGLAAANGQESTHDHGATQGGKHKQLVEAGVTVRVS